LRFLVEIRTVAGVVRGGIGYDPVREEVCECAFRRIVLGCRYEKFSGCVEVVLMLRSPDARGLVAKAGSPE